MIHWTLHTPCCWGKPACGRGEMSLTHAERTRYATLRVPKRRADWLLGRLTAKAVVADALQAAHPGRWPLESIEIDTEPSGMPFARIAPEAVRVPALEPGERIPVSLSISHTASHALCAATWTGTNSSACDRWSVGIDLGVIEPRSDDFVRIFFTEAEQRYVFEGPVYERDLRANFVWCAKEAVLKALGVGLTVDTFELTCLPDETGPHAAAWMLVPADQEWRPFTAHCGPQLIPGGGVVRGLWRSFPGFIGAMAIRLAPAQTAAGTVAIEGAPAA